MSFIVSAFDDTYKSLLHPVAPLAYFGLKLTTLDMLATFRLCIALRQLKEMMRRAHLKKEKEVEASVKASSFTRSAAATLIVVFGGEAITAPFLGQPPSFMVSGVSPMLYIIAQAMVDVIPSVPEPSVYLEFPLSLLDGFSRAFLLCTLVPSAVVNTSKFPEAATSPWCLLLTSFIVANGGFFMTNMFSLFHPTPLTLQTPPEMQAYGWMIADLWTAPLMTGIFALLTHAQPFWAELHTMIGGEKAVDPDSVRALCAFLLATIFSGRTLKNFLPGLLEERKKVLEARSQ